MKKPNKKHKAYVRSILAEEDSDIVKYRMMRLDDFESVSIRYGWTSFAKFTLYGGKQFTARWCAERTGDVLKGIFRELLAYRRQGRNKYRKINKRDSR